MASKAELEGDIRYIKTPKAQPSAFESTQDCGVPITSVSLEDARSAAALPH